MQRRPGGRKRARDEEEEEESSSSSEEDWREEVWRRGYQGPFSPFGPHCWQMWQSGAAMAQFQGQYGNMSFGAPGPGHAPGGRNPWGQPRPPREPPPPPPDPSGSSRARKRGRQQRRFFPPLEAESEEPADPALQMKMETVEVPKKYIAKIIGKKGTTIRQIRDETGAHVDARDQTTDPCLVKVLGTPDAIEAARKRIGELIMESSRKPGIVVEIPRAKIGKVIGIKGAQVHQIQMTTGAKVDVDKDVDPCRVTIGGTPDQIADAEQAVLTLAMEAADQESQYLDLPSAVSGAVLGVKGGRLLELQAASGARIDVDKTQPWLCRVRIQGTSDQIEHAKTLVMLATEAPRPPEATLVGKDGEEPRQAVEVVELPPGMAGRVIGKSGATIQLIQGESGARVWVDCDANQVRISGGAQAMEHAKHLVQALVEEETASAAADPLDGFAGALDGAAAGAQGMVWKPVLVAAPERGALGAAPGAGGAGGATGWGPDGTEEEVQWGSVGGEEAPWGHAEPEASAPAEDEDQPAKRRRTAMQRAFSALAARSHLPLERPQPEELA